MRTQKKQWLALAFVAAVSGSAFAAGNSGGNGIGAGGGDAGGAAGVTVPGDGGANQGYNRSGADTGYGSPGVTGVGGGQGTGTGATPNPPSRAAGNSNMNNMQMSPNSTMNNGQ